jgi:hypothetical protein
VQLVTERDQEGVLLRFVGLLMLDENWVYFEPAPKPSV